MLHKNNTDVSCCVELNVYITQSQQPHSSLRYTSMRHIDRFHVASTQLQIMI
jgi:hypothetical protein